MVEMKRFRSLDLFTKYYFCPETGQRFYTYEDMMRYVNYAKEAGLPMYIPVRLSCTCCILFFRKKKKTGQCSESADYQIEKSLDSGKGTDIEESLNLEKGSDIEKSLDSKEGTDTESLDSQKTADAEDSDFPKNDPSENISASEADILPSKDPFILEPASMQANIVHPPAVENPNPVYQGPPVTTIRPGNEGPMPTLARTNARGALGIRKR